jgi:CubicO group peptidase (beta-lactamase class C family)
MTPPLPVASPAACKLDPKRLAIAVDLVRRAVDTGGVPGAVLLVARNGKTVVREAFGNAVTRPTPSPATPDTVYDLASLTKCIATGLLCAKLIEERRIRLDDNVGTILPEFADSARRPGWEERGTVTFRHLMTHCAGLPAGGAYAGKTVTIDQIVRDIAQSRRMSKPGIEFLYSDFSAIALGAAIERLENAPLDVVARERIFSPLGMDSTRYRPGPFLAPRCASTVPDFDTSANRGRVHDPTARALGGVAGHAGIFSTVDDLARIAQLLLNDGTYGGVRLLRPETVRLATTPQSPFAGEARGLLWDIDSGYHIRGALARDSFGHTGFTGTSIWIDRTAQCFVILLTNAVHAKPPVRTVIPLRRELSSAVANALR